MKMIHMYSKEELRKEYRTNLILFTATAFMLGFTIALTLVVVSKGITL